MNNDSTPFFQPEQRRQVLGRSLPIPDDSDLELRSQKFIVATISEGGAGCSWCRSEMW